MPTTNQRSITLHHAVVHELIKDAGQSAQPNRLAPQLLDTGNQDVLDLVEQVSGLIGQHGNTANYGTFSGSASSPHAHTRVPAEIKTYALGVKFSDASFYALSILIMDALHSMANTQTLATGGYIVFADYETASVRYLLVGMIKQRPGITMDNLIPVGITELDLNKLHQVARVNFSRLRQSEAGEEDVPDVPYISFVSPKRNREAAGYFITALGCIPGTPAKKATDAAIKGVEQFFDTEPSLASYKDEVKDDLVDMFLRSEKEGTTVTLSGIESVARRHFHTDDEDELETLVNGLTMLLQSSDFEVPNEFSPSRSALTKYIRFTYKGDGLKVDIDRKQIGDDDGEPVFFDQRNGRLVISEENFIEELTRYMGDGR